MTPRETMLMLARALNTIRYEVTGALANYLSPDQNIKRSLIRIECCARDALESLSAAADGQHGEAGAVTGTNAAPQEPRLEVGAPTLDQIERKSRGEPAVAAPRGSKNER